MTPGPVSTPFWCSSVSETSFVRFAVVFWLWLVLSRGARRGVSVASPFDRAEIERRPSARVPRASGARSSVGRSLSSLVCVVVGIGSDPVIPCGLQHVQRTYRASSRVTTSIRYQRPLAATTLCLTATAWPCCGSRPTALSLLGGRQAAPERRASGPTGLYCSTLFVGNRAQYLCARATGERRRLGVTSVVAGTDRPSDGCADGECRLGAGRRSACLAMAMRADPGARLSLD